MSDVIKVIGDKIIRKDPTKSNKNYRCKIHAAKLRQKKIREGGVDALVQFNQQKREKSNLKKQNEVELVRVCKLQGDHARHKRLREVEEQLVSLKKQLQDKDVDLKNERAIRKDYQSELGKSQCMVADLKKEHEKIKKENEALWGLIRLQKQKLNAMQNVS